MFAAGPRQRTLFHSLIGAHVVWARGPRAFTIIGGKYSIHPTKVPYLPIDMHAPRDFVAKWLSELRNGSLWVQGSLLKYVGKRHCHSFSQDKTGVCPHIPLLYTINFDTFPLSRGKPIKMYFHIHGQNSATFVYLAIERKTLR